MIDLVPHYKESPLVQKAMQDLERILAEKQWENTAEQTKAEGTMGRKVSVLKALKAVSYTHLIKCRVEKHRIYGS